jgi:hypothetical protein
MKFKNIIVLTVSAFGLTLSHASNIENLTEFQENTIAKSSEVNANFKALQAAVNDNFEALEALNLKVSAEGNVAGRCYDYQSTSQKLRNFEAKNGSLVAAYVEMLDKDAVLSFDANNQIATLVGEEHHVIVNTSNGSFKESSDSDNYTKPVKINTYDIQVQWVQKDKVVTISIPRTAVTEQYDLQVSADGTLLTGVNRLNHTEPDGDLTEYKYTVENITLREIDCSAQ